MFKGGMASMMKKAQQMQENMQKAQAEIKNLSATGTAAGGAVSITLNGEHLATEISIDEAMLEDKDMLEDLVLTAINDASTKLASASEVKMKEATGGMQMPAGMNLPF